MEKISIIIPVHNEELYVKQCIESVLSQSYQNLEVIIIDDGSQDQSLSICQELSLADGRIRLFSQANSGVSAARNCGLDVATGEFVFFLDGDDAVHPFLIEELLRKMKKYDAAISMCNCRKVDDRQMEDIKGEFPECNNTCQCRIGDNIESEVWFHLTYSDELSGIGGKMIRRNTIGSMRFDEGLVYGEDTMFLYSLISKGIRIVYLELEWYYYRQHEKSITHSDDIKMNGGYLECTKIIRDMEYDKKNNSFASYWEKRVVKKMINISFLIKKNRDKKEWRKFRKLMIAESGHPLFHTLESGEKILFWVSLFSQPLYNLWIHGIRYYLWKILRAMEKTVT